MQRDMGKATRWLLRGLALLLVLLVIVAVVAAAGEGRSAWLVGAVAAAFLALHFWGATQERRLVPLDVHRARLAPEGLWIGGLIACWLAMLWLTPSALWIAFPLTFLALHALGPRWGVVTTGMITLVAVAHGLVRMDGAIGAALGLDVAVAVEPLEAPMIVGAALLRITQSALHNITQHAQATHAEVALSRSDGVVRLRIADDGVGFDEPSPASDRGFGLAAMRSRVVELGGLFDASSAPGDGTVIVATIPLEQP